MMQTCSPVQPGSTTLISVLLVVLPLSHVNVCVNSNGCQVEFKPLDAHLEP